jgi:hypothetical protein
VKVTVDRRRWTRYDGMMKRLEDAVYLILRRQDARNENAQGS